MACLPWWHNKFDSVPAFTVSLRGCAVNSAGNVPCAPETLRADAERQMNDAGYSGGLSLEAYTLARYLQSEVGTKSVEQSVAVVEAAINRAKMWNLPRGVLSLLLYRQSSSSPNYGYYGPIHGIGTGVSTAPYGRWAATSRDPSLKALLIAKFVAAGYSNNFTRGADDQAGPENWIKQGQGALNNWVTSRLASQGKYWIGPTPGIDHWTTFLTFTPGVSAKSAEGQALVQRGVDALALPAVHPDWSGLPICTRGFSSNETVLMAVAGVVGVASAIMFDRWLTTGKPV